MAILRPTKGNLNSQISSQKANVSVSPLKVEKNKAAINHVAKEASKLIAINTTDGNTTAVQQNLEENIKSSLNLVTAVLNDTMSGISIKKNVNNASTLSTMTGESIVNGFNKAAVLASSPLGLNTLIKNTDLKTTLTSKQKQDIMKNASIVADKVNEVLESDIPKNLIKKARSISANKMVSAGNPLSNLLKKTKDGGQIGPAGYSFGNTLASAFSKASDGTLMSKFGDEIKLPNTVIDTDKIDALVSKLGDTNFVENFAVTNLTGENIGPSVKQTNVTQIQNEFNGYSTSTNYQFVVIDRTQLIRRLTNPSREFTTLIVEWTHPLVGPTNLVNARKIHEITNVWAQANLSAQARSANNLQLGIQPHFLILSDGSLQLGRPIDIARYEGLNKFPERGVELMFVANKDRPVSDIQMNTFHEFVKCWFAVYPGNPVIEAKRIDDTTTGPGFNIADFISSKFNKRDIYSYVDITSLEDALTPEELSEIDLQSDIVQPSHKNESATIKADGLKEEAEGKDDTTGEFKKYTGTEIAEAKTNRAAAIDTIKKANELKSSLVEAARKMEKATDLYDLNMTYVARQDLIIKQELSKIFDFDKIISRPEGVQ